MNESRSGGGGGAATENGLDKTLTLLVRRAVLSEMTERWADMSISVLPTANGDAGMAHHSYT